MNWRYLQRRMKLVIECSRKRIYNAQGTLQLRTVWGRLHATGPSCWVAEIFLPPLRRLRHRSKTFSLRHSVGEAWWLAWQSQAAPPHSIVYPNSLTHFWEAHYLHSLSTSPFNSLSHTCNDACSNSLSRRSPLTLCARHCCRSRSRQGKSCA